ncbi:MAG TPA: hypothetical protein VLH56_05830 [Dissulfurispiraceae bacterium]|nr:hypothetical protein [Dissulfurispiraceae bacterium]
MFFINETGHVTFREDTEQDVLFSNEDAAHFAGSHQRKRVTKKAARRNALNITVHDFADFFASTKYSMPMSLSDFGMS